MKISMNSVYMWVSCNRMEANVPVTVVGTRRNDFKLGNGWVVDQFGVAEGTKRTPGGRIIELDEAKDHLAKELSITFPKLSVQHREHDNRHDLMIAEGENHAMPDGQRIFAGDWAEWDEETFPNSVHVGFEAWLTGKGFYLERYDSFWWMPTPLYTVTEKAAFTRLVKAISFDPESLPF